MKTAFVVMVFIIGFIAGQIFFHPGIYKAYAFIGERMTEVKAQKESVVNQYEDRELWR